MDILEGFLDALYPADIKCLLCDGELRRDEFSICAGCEELLESADDRTIFGLDGFAAGLKYTDVLRGAVHRFKYAGETGMAGFLAQFTDIPEDWDIDVIVPVPLHKRKLARRGYNQSEFLAEEFSARLGLPVDCGLIKRVRNTKTQTRFGQARRRSNFHGAFLAEGCEGKRILLVDDVCTTGSTLLECAAALRAAGAVRIYAAAACSAG